MTQPATLPDARSDARSEALAWLTERYRWETLLTDLRTRSAATGGVVALIGAAPVPVDLDADLASARAA